MSDSLRDRIAAAIYTDNPYGWSRDQCEQAADAVIRDVLTPEFLADLVIAAVQKAADNE
jgi:hypothetical protein